MEAEIDSRINQNKKKTDIEDINSANELSELDTEQPLLDECDKPNCSSDVLQKGCAQQKHFPVSKWYHGRLTREEAEGRLYAANGTARFLVRESDKRPGNYVLSSILADNGKIMHYLITCVCGDYYLAGRKFSDLETLVNNHLFSVDAKLTSFRPVEPPSEVLLKSNQRIALLPFSGMPDTDELSFKKGDILTVHQELEAGWFWATLERTDEKGLVYSGLTKELSLSAILLHQLPYFHANVEVRCLAEQLALAGMDSFLVTSSGSKNHSFTLMVNIGRRIEKFRIGTSDGGKFELGGRYFNSINDIIERYKQTDICEGHQLSRAVFREDFFNNNNNNNNTATTNNEHDHFDLNNGSLVIDESRVEFQRLSSHSSCPDAIKTGRAWKKSKEQKKWKPIYLRLSDFAGDGQLFCFESEKRTKPKLVLDLYYCRLLLIHESLFGRPNCIQLLIVNSSGVGVADQHCQAVAAFFYFEAEEEFADWLSLLRAYCQGCPNDRIMSCSENNINNNNNNENGKLRQMQKQSLFTRRNSLPQSSSTAVIKQRPLFVRKKYFLQLTIHEARNLASKSETEFYAIVILAGAKVARTCSVPTSKSDMAVWDASFVIEDMPTPYTVLQFQLGSVQRGKTKERKIGITAPIDLYVGKPIESRPCLPVPPKNAMSRSIYESFGSWQLRVSASRSELIVMPEDEYSSLKYLLTANSFKLIHWLGTRLNSDTRQQFTGAVLNVFLEDGKYLDLIEAEIDRELAQCEDVKTLFRRDSLCCSLISACLRRFSTSLVTSILQPHINRLVEIQQPFDVDLTSEDGDFAPQSPQIAACVEDLLNSVYTSADRFPLNVRYIFWLVRSRACARWTHEVGLRAVSAFVILRLFALALADPQRFNLISGVVPFPAAHNLIQLAKLLQAVAAKCLSSQKFAQKEKKEDGCSMRSFLADTKCRMSSFLSQISIGVKEEAVQSSIHQSSERHKDIAEHLALIAEIAQQTVSSHSSSDQQESVVKMRMVLELLCKHKDQYCGGVF